MKVHIKYENPTGAHVQLRLFINGALSGVLTLRNEEVEDFQHIMVDGCSNGVDGFRASGHLGPNFINSSKLLAEEVTPTVVGHPDE